MRDATGPQVQQGEWDVVSVDADTGEFVSAQPLTWAESATAEVFACLASGNE